jgi:hypothetical protein
MKYANIEKSDRLQRVAEVLAQGGEFSTLDIIKKANVCAVNSIISELRLNGYEINCERRGEKWFYRMEQA